MAQRPFLLAPLGKIIAASWVWNPAAVKLALGFVPGIVPDFYVNSVSGSDSNNGLSLLTAKQTLAAADSLLVTSSHLGLVAGSSWREALAPTEAGIVVSSTGGLPLIDGSSVATGWTAHPTEANVWEKAGWTHDATGSNRLTIYENGQLLTRVANAAACAADPGSFVDIKGSDGSPLTLTIHANGSGNPNSNGKVYEASKRLSVFSAEGNGITASGFHTRRQISNNGSFVAGQNATVSRILASDGHKHNFFMASGVASDCIAYAADPTTSYELSNTLFVSFMDNPSAATAVYERCGAIQPSGIGNGGTAIYAHGNPNPFLAVTLRQFWAVGNISFQHPGGGATARANCLSEGCYSRALAMNLEYGVNRYSMGYSPLALATTNSLQDATHTDAAIYIEERYDAGNFDEFIRMAGTGNRILTNCAFVCKAPGNTNFMANSSASAGTLQVNKTIIHGFGNGLWLDPDAPYAGTYNIFWGGGSNDFQAHDGTTYRTTLAAWQSATGQDAQSVRCAAADQVAGGANALWLAYANASGGTALTTIGPAVGDFRINPNARVYSGAGTAYIGTFPDGTLLITAGPQNYWNWNSRAVASGAPQKFPNVPDTLAECEIYVTNPPAWNFYP